MVFFIERLQSLHTDWVKWVKSGHFYHKQCWRTHILSAMSFSYVRNNYTDGRNPASGGGNGYEGAYQACHNDCNHNHALKNGGHNEKRSCSLSERVISCSRLAMQHMALARLSISLICTSIHHGLSEKHADGRLCKRSARFFSFRSKAFTSCWRRSNIYNIPSRPLSICLCSFARPSVCIRFIFCPN